jgi:membrane-associated phospholipid phosphatase
MVGAVEAVKSLDIRFNQVVESNQHPAMVQGLEALTSLGSFHFAGVVLVFLWSFGEMMLLKELTVGLTASTALIYSGKHIVNRKRPEKGIEHIVKRASFPSGHSGTAFVTATVLYSHFNRGAIFFSLAAVVAFSRVYLEDHYLSDAVVGALTGLAIGLLITAL